MVYGWNTHSFLNSTEHRQMKKERAQLTKRFESQTREKVLVGPVCTCSQREYPHDIDVHERPPFGDWGYCK